MMLESDWNQNRNHLLLELESESWILENPGIGIRIGINPSGIGIGIGITGTGIIYNSGVKCTYLLFISCSTAVQQGANLDGVKT